MCGIIGLIMWPAENERNDDARNTFAKLAFTSLLEQTQSRGTDATGVAIHLANNSWVGLKASYKAEDFISLDPSDPKLKEVASSSCFEEGDTSKEIIPAQSAYIPFMNKYWTENPEKVRSVLGHCRKATEGTPENLLNNHPLEVGKIVGIHNGGVKNADEIFKKHKDNFLPRIGQVDSEVIFQLMNFYHPADEAGGIDYLKEVTCRLEMHASTGGSAVVAFHKDFPGVFYAFCKAQRPLVFAFSASLGMLFIISEVEFMKGIASFLKAQSYFDKNVPSPIKFEFKTSPINEAYIIDAREPLGTKATLDDIMKHADVSKLLKEYDTTPQHSTQTYNQVNGYGWGGCSHRQNVQNAYDHSTTTAVSKPASEEAEKSIPITTERYDVKTDSNIIEIPPTAKPETAPAKKEESQSAASVYDEVIKYISPKSWWKFIGIFAEKDRDKIFEQIKVLIKEAHGKGFAKEAEQFANLKDGLRHLLLYRTETLDCLRNVIELVDQNTSLSKQELLTLLNAQSQTDLENEWSSINQNDEVQDNITAV